MTAGLQEHMIHQEAAVLHQAIHQVHLVAAEAVEAAEVVEVALLPVPEDSNEKISDHLISLIFEIN